MQPRQVVALVLCVGLTGTPLRAEQAGEPALASLAPGQRIRFETTTIGFRYATVMETDGEALVLRLVNLDGTDRTLHVPWSDLRSLEVAAGQRSYAGAGALIGFIPSAVAGGVLGHYTFACLDAEGQPCDPSAYIVMTAVVCGLIGALIGGGIGASLKADRWEKVGTTPQARLQLAPAKGGGLAVGLSLSF